MPDTLFELEQAYDRSELATVFRELADTLEAGHAFDLHTADGRLSVDVPPRVVAELEAEHEADDPTPVATLEFELEWDDADGSTIRVDDAVEPGGDHSDDDGAAATDDAAADTDGTAADLETTSGDGASAADGATGSTTETAADPATAAIPPEAVASGTPSEGERSKPTGERTSRFEVYEDRGGEWRWRLVHWNGNIVADSGEGYASRSNAERAARAVMRSAPTATIERLDG